MFDTVNSWIIMSQLSLSDMQIRALLPTGLAYIHKLPLCKQKCTGWWEQQVVAVQSTSLATSFKGNLSQAW